MMLNSLSPKKFTALIKDAQKQIIFRTVCSAREELLSIFSLKGGNASLKWGRLVEGTGKETVPQGSLHHC